MFSLIIWGMAILFNQSLFAGDRELAARPRAAIDPTLASRLAGDFRTAITDKPLRGAVQSIADSLQLNVWLDREVDPTTLVSTAADTKTAFQAITSLAQPVGLSVAVVDNVILIGRGGWVERTAAAVLSAPGSGSIQGISWPDLTTPTQAALNCGARASTSLPHDLWPAVSWKKMDPSIAHRLVAAQFDRMPSATASAGYASEGYVRLQSPARISALYPSGAHAKRLRAAVTQADRTATMKELDSQLFITGSISAHLAATTAWLTHADPARPSHIDLDSVKFSLRIENTSAEKVFRQLATTAGRRLIVQPEASDSCQRLISFTANDQSLRELCHTVADAAAVSAAWTESDLTISPQP